MYRNLELYHASWYNRSINVLNIEFLSNLEEIFRYTQFFIIDKRDFKGFQIQCQRNMLKYFENIILHIFKVF